MRRTVQFVALQRSFHPYDRLDTFQLRPERGMKWLQKACIWVLRKLQCHARDGTLEIERVTIDAPTFVERLFHQDYALRDTLGRGAKTLLIGSEDYAELMSDKNIMTNMFSFNAEYGYNRRILGFRVVVVPSMRGSVLLPEGAL